jgi:hypothetical protein
VNLLYKTKSYQTRGTEQRQPASSQAFQSLTAEEKSNAGA